MSEIHFYLINDYSYPIRDFMYQDLSFHEIMLSLWPCTVDKKTRRRYDLGK